jgi:hypothetical protein
MADGGAKRHLHDYLQVAREAMLWKLDGLGEYDVRRPLTPTGTNLLGMVKHLTWVELGYFGDTFGRKLKPLLWETTDDVTDDMWVRPEESRSDIVDGYRAAWRHSDETIDALDLDATGRVPWWPPERGDVTLARILVHMTTETCRHAGHADILREQIDSAAGFALGKDNLPAGFDAAGWKAYADRIEAAARAAAGGPADGGPAAGGPAQP